MLKGLCGGGEIREREKNYNGYWFGRDRSRVFF
jgi:hypothetical protein